MKYNNVYKLYKLGFISLVLCGSMLGCDEPTANKYYDVLCESSGGAYDETSKLCKCGENACDSGVVCDSADKTKCAGTPVVDPDPVDPVDPNKAVCEASGGAYDVTAKQCKCGENACDSGVVCDSADKTKCAGTPVVDPVDPNKSACEASGGAYDVTAKQCKCGENACDSGIVCDRADKTKCANFDCIPATSVCLNGAYQLCSDQGHWAALQACPNDVSCKSASECGECRDGDMRCEEDAETNAGTLKVCVQGQWEVNNACADAEGRPASCLKEEEGVSTACGECINRPTQQCTNVKTTGASSDLLIGHLYICEGGKMHGFKQTDSVIQYTDDKYVKCGAGNSCNPERTDCGECCVGRRICRNDGIVRKDNGYPDGTIGQIYTCVDGVISSESTPCPNETLCDERTLGQSCGECGVTSRWHHGYNCLTTSDGRQHSQTCATGHGGGDWTYHGYWKKQNTCTNMCISDTTYGENCYGKCLLSNNQC